MSEPPRFRNRPPTIGYMSTAAYKVWVRNGKPWRKAQPIEDIEAWAEAHGVDVLGTIGNEAHLKASFPEDHTPFSMTAWPRPLPGYVITAIDLEDVARLATQILAAARAGRLPWLKYANLNGRHYRTQDGFRNSTDSGDEHVHLSIRTDHLNTRVPLDWLDLPSGPVTPPRPPTSTPAPGPDVAFPLPAGHWFGRDDGTMRSHSGLHGRRTAGKADSEWIQIWARQLGKRGWSIGKGQTWLTRAGNDGKIGPEYEALFEAFQLDQRLDRDRMLGPRTWNAAFDRPVT